MLWPLPNWRGGWVTHHTNLTPIFINAKLEKTEWKKITSHNHTLSTNMSQRIHIKITQRTCTTLGLYINTHAKAVSVVRDVLHSNWEDKNKQIKENKFSDNEFGHETHSAARKSSTVSTYSEKHGLTLNLLWEAIFEMKDCTSCRCARRSHLPLCCSHDDGTCVATISPWQL